MAPAGPKPYRLTLRARADLEEIWLFTADRWSIAQAEKYLAEIFRAFERIAENPSLVRERSELVPPVRIYRIHAHLVIYRDEADHIAIVRVRHRAEDWANDPAGEA